jgi:hypothetical protein
MRYASDVLVHRFLQLEEHTYKKVFNERATTTIRNENWKIFLRLLSFVQYIRKHYVLRIPLCINKKCICVFS